MGFHPTLGETSAGGQLVTTGESLRFESDSVKVELAFAGLKIELGGHNNQHVFFHHPQAAGWTISTPDKEILNEPHFHKRTQLRQQIEAILEREEGLRRLRVTVVALLVFAIVSATLFVLSGALLRLMVNRVPPVFEQKVGAEMAAAVRRGEHVLDDTNSLVQLKALVALVARGSPPGGFEFQVVLLADPEPNAFAVPGGYIFVNQGLLGLAETREELAGVLAHEMAHVTRRHGLRRIIASAGPSLLLKIFVGQDDSVAGTIGRGSHLLVRQSFSRDYEWEADDTAWQTLVAAKIDPRGLADFLKKLRVEEEKQRKRAEEFGGKVVEVRALSSHPPTGKRIQRLDSNWQKLEDKTNFVSLEKGWPKKPE